MFPKISQVVLCYQILSLICYGILVILGRSIVILNVGEEKPPMLSFVSTTIQNVGSLIFCSNLCF